MSNSRHQISDGWLSEPAPPLLDKLLQPFADRSVSGVEEKLALAEDSELVEKSTLWITPVLVWKWSIFQLIERIFLLTGALELLVGRVGLLWYPIANMLRFSLIALTECPHKWSLKKKSASLSCIIGIIFSTIFQNTVSSIRSFSKPFNTLKIIQKVATLFEKAILLRMSSK